jgi:tRNA splicing ligase
MLAMVFALLDQSAVMEPQHIKAALAWINYWKDSVNYIFGTLAARAETNKMNETAKGVYEFITKNSGCTRTDLTKFFKHKLNSAELTSALNHLMNAAPPLVKQEMKPRADGKPGKGTIVFWKV